MPEHRPGVTILDDPLAQFDRLLRDVQVALAPEREPAPPAQPRARPATPPEPQVDAPPEPQVDGQPEPQVDGQPEPQVEVPPGPSLEPSPDVTAHAQPAEESEQPAEESEAPRGREGPLAEILSQQRTAPQPESARGRTGPLAEILERARREAQAAKSEPEPEPAPHAGEPAEPGGPVRPDCCRQDLTQGLSALGELSSSLEQLRASLGELLAGYQGALIRALAVPAAPPPVPAPTAAQGPATASPPAGRTVGSEFTLVAGPFVRLEAVRAFQQALLDLPGIDQVAIRGYEGADRAIVDVRLAEPNS